MDRNAFLKGIAAGGIFAALSPISRAAGNGGSLPFTKFEMKQRVFEAGKL